MSSTPELPGLIDAAVGSLPTTAVVTQSPEDRLNARVYETPNPALLSQGDILKFSLLKEKLTPHNSSDLETEVYPYFLKNYQYGVILNSNCDLVLEKNRPLKVRCIQIAAVVEASDYMKKMLGKEEHHTYQVIDEKTYGNVIFQFEDLVNNQHKLYFYLPASEQIGFNSAYVVRLDTSVALQGDTSDKYQAFLDSRIATLKDPFNSKLGEKFAALFDRIGTDDYEEILGEDAFDEWKTKELRKYFTPVKDDIYKRSIGEIKKLARDDEERASKVKAILAANAKPTRERYVHHRALAEIEKALGSLPPPKRQEVMERLLKNPTFEEFLIKIEDPT